MGIIKDRIKLILIAVVVITTAIITVDFINNFQENKLNIEVTQELSKICTETNSNECD